MTNARQMSWGGWARLELTEPLVQLQSRSQEMVSEKIFLLGQGKVRVFHFKSGEIKVFERSQGNTTF